MAVDKTDLSAGGMEILRGERTGSYKKFIENCFETCPRQALHARTLGFKHPETGEELFFEAEVPDDMKNLIQRFENFEGQG